MRKQRVLIALLLILSLMAASKALSSGANPSIDYELRDILQATINQSDSFADRFDAEVWLVDMSSRLERFIASDEERLKLLRLVHTEATLA